MLLHTLKSLLVKAPAAAGPSRSETGWPRSNIPKNVSRGHRLANCKKAKQYFNRLSSQQGSWDFSSRTPRLILSKLTQDRTIFGQGKLLKAAGVWSSVYWNRIEGLGNNDFSGYNAGLGFGKEMAFQRT